MGRLIFVSGKGFINSDDAIAQSDSATQSDIPETTTSDNILEILANLQTELDASRNEKQKALTLLNDYRLMMFPTDTPSSGDTKRKAKISISEMLQTEGGYGRVEKYLKHLREMYSELTELVDEFKSKNVIKIRNEQASDKKKNEVNKLRETGNKVKQKGPAKYTPTEKIIKGLRNTFKGKLTHTKLIDMMMTTTGGTMSRDEIQAIIDKQIAREKGIETK